jgi:penicillin-insensitive murein endopeptidase
MRAVLRGVRFALKAVFLLVLASGSVLAFLALEGKDESVCFGDTNAGRLENSRRLPFSGDNFSTYWSLGWLLGRTNMHGTPRDIVVDAYASLAQSDPDLTFVYGEAGWPWGGWFWPHRTHQNGLSVDFVVPVRDAEGSSIPFPRTMWTGGFYAVDVNSDGRFGEYRIDFDAMAAQLTALRVAAAKKNARIRRVFFDPGLQLRLFATPAGADLSSQISFSTNRSWFRHDAHYHVDFDMPCRPLG